MLSRLDDAFERERRFTSDAAHELRTPVSAILAQSDFALSEAADDSDRAEAIGEIHSRALGMRELIGKLLVLSRMDARQEIAEPEATDIGEAAEIAAEAFADAAEEKNISIHTDISGGMVMGDQTMLTQTVMNLVENAVRYGKPGGRRHWHGG